MIFGLTTLAIAILISAVSAYYSVLGLMAIFAAATVPIIIMGTVLEAGKVMTAVWLHRNWRRAELQYKLYLVPAVVFLMLLTSMGVYGFLSKAHLDQSVPSGDIAAQVQLIDEKIATQRQNIEGARRAITQMDQSVDQLMARSNDEAGATKSANLRRSQQKERGQLQNDIAKAQKEIVKLQEERAPIASQARKVEAEVGPIKYVAALIYGNSTDQSVLERAVRFVIIMIVIVFDPLAIVLILAGIKHIEWEREAKLRAKETMADIVTAPEPVEELIKDVDIKLDEPLPPESVPDIEQANVSAQLAVEEVQDIDIDEFVAEQVEEDTAAHRLVIDELVRSKEDLELLATELASKETDLVKSVEAVSDLETKLRDLQLERDLLFSAHSQEMIRADELANQLADLIKPQEEPEPVVPAAPVDVPATMVPTKFVTPEPPATAPRNKAEVEPTVPTTPMVEIPTRAVQSDFGMEFPASPERGDMYMRVDFVPARLFRWSGVKWMEINKNTTDLYSFNDQYIQFLADKLGTGEFAIEDLSENELHQVQTVLGGRRG